MSNLFTDKALLKQLQSKFPFCLDLSSYREPDLEDTRTYYFIKFEHDGHIMYTSFGIYSSVENEFLFSARINGIEACIARYENAKISGDDYRYFIEDQMYSNFSFLNKNRASYNFDPFDDFVNNILNKYNVDEFLCEFDTFDFSDLMNITA